MLRDAHPLLLALLLALSACASSSGGAGVGVAPVSTGRHGPGPASRGRPTDPATALLRAGTGDAITTAEARAMFGAPDVDRRDGVGALLVWTLPTCALTLGFAHDRLQSVTPGPRRTGEAAPSLQTCLAEAHARAAAS